MKRTSRVAAIALMMAAATLWSIAGVVTRTLTPALQSGGGFEIVFWRSLFAALFVAGYLVLVDGRGLAPVRAAGRAGLVCGAMWCVMFSCFMFALTLTTVANVLVVMGIAPLVTALLARAVLGTPIPGRTVAAITAATIGLVSMFAQDAGTGPPGRQAAGMLVALLVPLAGAVNLVTLARSGSRVDLIPAVLIGGVFSALLMFPLALPLRATATDVGWLALLGCVQLALPCMLLVLAARRLSPPEIALIGMLELVLGPLWVWLGAGETPSHATLVGGAIVLAALFANEVAGMVRTRGRREVS